MKRLKMENKFNLSEKLLYYGEISSGRVIQEEDVKEFIKRLLTPNNVSKGFVEISTIKYYAGVKLI